jgi:transposase-like protein
MIPTLEASNMILFNEEKCIEFLFSQGILYNRDKCRRCSAFLKRESLLFRCTRKRCKKSVSIFKNSFFGKSRVKCSMALLIGYLWLCKASRTTIMMSTGLSSATITDYIGYYRALIARSLKNTEKMIGGPGIIVQIDECKLGKRKYHRGHKVEGVWVIGGVEKTEKRAVFLESVPDRSADTLLSVISRRVARDSIIHTDMWKSYEKIEEKLGIEHFTVNHSENFKDPETGVHTNAIEGTWNGLKLRIPARNRNKKDVDAHLSEFIWRRENENNLWDGLLGSNAV